MRLTKLDDHQSWMISEDDVHVLVDPWLTQSLGGWLFSRGRREAPLSAEALPRPSAILVSSRADDHLSPETLAAFARDTPVHAPAAAARRIRSLGFSDVRAHAVGSVFDVAGLRVTTVVSGFPYAGHALGFLVESRVTDARVYVEAHATDEARLTAIPPGLDALVCPCESVFTGIVQLSMDPERAARTIARLRPRRFLPTGVEPDRSEGLFGRALRRTSGSIAELERILVERRLETRLIAPRTGDVIELDRVSLASADPRSVAREHRRP